MGQNEGFVMVLSVRDAFAAALAKSILDEVEIFYVSQGEIQQELIAPGRIGGLNQVAGPVELLVSREDAGRARELLEDIELPPSEPSLGSEDDDVEG